jgi:polar amino acid transport system ATP-binding protein
MALHATESKSGPNGKAIVRFEDVVKNFGSLSVLDRLSLEVPAGEKLAIIGRSGSGKSTILRIIMTLEAIDAGCVEVDGIRLPAGRGGVDDADDERLRSVRSRVGMVFQHFNLFPHMTVLRNVTEAPRRVLGLAPEDAEERGRELLGMVGLGDKADAHPARLSGGQKQRVAIARALAMQPKLMLFDEITSALDPELVGEVLAVLRDLASRRDITMLLVTHQMSFAREFADRVAFVDQGRIVEDGSPDRILTDPADPRTREVLKLVLQA